MFEILLRIAFLLYVAASLCLVFYGLNAYTMVFLFRKRVRGTTERQIAIEEEWRSLHPSGETEGLPKITTQIPLYNEVNVAERCIRAVAAFDYPASLHQIQVLDDSNDETRELVDRVAAELREQGIWIDVFRRKIRHGYKAGALSDAMPEAHGEFIAIFDSDFVPQPEFLRQLIPHFADEKTGLVQARWGHLNTSHSLLTEAQSVGIDGHFVIEQTARSANHLFLNFNGTAGIWRRTAIEEAGGWTADTLTEDLDLSYRAQLKGWHMEYVPHVVVPAELPETYSAFKSQQFRWAKGSIQTAIKLLPTVFTSEKPFFTKFQSIFHLCHYFAHPMMFVVSLLALPALQYLSRDFNTSFLIMIAGPLLAATLGPSMLYIVSQRYLHPHGWRKRILLLPGLVLVGFGICISNTRAVLEAILGVKSGFIRTPKRGSKTSKSYNPAANLIPILEITAAIYCAISVFIYYTHESYGIIPFLTLYIGGFSLVGISSLREQIHARSKS